MSCSSDNHHNHIHGHNNRRPGGNTDYRKNSKLRSRSPSSECLSRCCSRSSSRSSSSSSTSSHSCSCSSCCSSGSSVSSHSSSTSNSDSSSSSSDNEDGIDQRNNTDKSGLFPQQSSTVRDTKSTKYVLSTTREPLKLTISKSSLGLGSTQPRTKNESQSIPTATCTSKVQSICKNDQKNRNYDQSVIESETRRQNPHEVDQTDSQQADSSQSKQPMPKNEERLKLRSFRINHIRSRSSNTQVPQESVIEQSKISQKNTPPVLTREQKVTKPTNEREERTTVYVSNTAPIIQGARSTKVSSNVQTAPAGLRVNVINIPVTKSFIATSAPFISTPIFSNLPPVNTNIQYPKEQLKDSISAPSIESVNPRPMTFNTAERKAPPLKSLKLIKERSKIDPKNSNGKLECEKRKLVVDESKLRSNSVVTENVPISEPQVPCIPARSNAIPISVSVLPQMTNLAVGKAERFHEPHLKELKKKTLVTKAARKCMSYDEKPNTPENRPEPAKNNEILDQAIQSTSQSEFQRAELRKQHIFLTSSNPDLFSPPIKRRDLMSPSSHSVTSSSQSIASPCVRQEWTSEDKSKCNQKPSKKETNRSKSSCQSKSKQKSVPTKAAVKCMFSENKHKSKPARKPVGAAEVNNLIDSLDEMKIDETRSSRRILKQSNNCFSNSKLTLKLHSPISAIFSESKSVTPNSMKRFSVPSPCRSTNLLSPNLRNDVLQQNFFSNHLLQQLNWYNELMSTQFQPAPSSQLPSPLMFMPPMLASQFIWPKILSHLQSVAPVPKPISQISNFDSPKSCQSFSPGLIKFKSSVPSNATSQGEGKKSKHRRHDEKSKSRSCSKDSKKKKKSKKSGKRDKNFDDNHTVLQGLDLHHGQYQVASAHKEEESKSSSGGKEGKVSRKSSSKKSKSQQAAVESSVQQTFSPAVSANEDASLMMSKKDERRKTRSRKGGASRSCGEEDGEKMKEEEEAEEGNWGEMRTGEQGKCLPVFISTKKETTRLRCQQRQPFAVNSGPQDHSSIQNAHVPEVLTKPFKESASNAPSAFCNTSDMHNKSAFSAPSSVDQIIEECSRLPPDKSSQHTTGLIQQCDSHLSEWWNTKSRSPKMITRTEKHASSKVNTNRKSNSLAAGIIGDGKEMELLRKKFGFGTVDQSDHISMIGSSPRMDEDNVKLTKTSLSSPNCDQLSTDLIANNMRQNLIVAPVNISSLNPSTSSLVSLRMGGSVSSASGEKPSTSNIVDPQPSTSSQHDEANRPSEVFVTEETPDYCTSQDNLKPIGVITGSSGSSKLSKKRKRTNKTGWDKPKKKVKKSDAVSTSSSGGPTSVSSLVGQEEIIVSSPVEVLSPPASCNVSPIIAPPKQVKKKPMIKAAKPRRVNASISEPVGTRIRSKALVDEKVKEQKTTKQKKNQASKPEGCVKPSKEKKVASIPLIKKAVAKEQTKKESNDIDAVKIQESVNASSSSYVPKISNVKQETESAKSTNIELKKPISVPTKDTGKKKPKAVMKNDEESNPEYDPATAPYIVITLPSNPEDSAKKRINRVKKNLMYKLPVKKFLKSGLFSDDYKIDLCPPPWNEIGVSALPAFKDENIVKAKEITGLTTSVSPDQIAGEPKVEKISNVIPAVNDPTVISSTSTSASSSPLHSADETDILDVMKTSTNSRPLLPPPAYCDKEVRDKMLEFLLPYDCYVYKLEMNETMNTGKKYRKIKQNIFADIKPLSNIEETVCECKPPPPDSAMEGCDSRCLNRCMMIECDPHLCPCQDRCSNQRMQKLKWAPGLERFMTNNRGWGVRTTEKIKEGDFILEYIGEVVSLKLFADRMVNMYHNDAHHYCLSLGPNTVIDGYRAANEGRFVNHSCEPNCVMQKWSANGLFRMGLFAARDIEVGEELSYDYNFDSYNNETQQICKCGSKQCRGVIGGKRKGSGSVPGSERRGSSDSSIASSVFSASSSKKSKGSTKPKARSFVKRKEQTLTQTVMPENVISVKEEVEDKPSETSIPSVILSQPSSSSVSQSSESLFCGNEPSKELSGMMASSPLSDPATEERRDEESKPLKKRKLKESQQGSSQVQDIVNQDKDVETAHDCP